MNLREFNALIGQDSYVRCMGKERIDPAIIGMEAAEAHLFSGGTIGWWVRPGYIVVDVDEGKEQFLEVIKEMGIKTLMTQTPKGVHMYFKTDRDFPQKIGMILPCGLKSDFRCASKGYVMLPFGMDGRKFNKITEVIELPLEFTPMANRKESLLGLKEGDGRNATLFGHLMAYKNKGASASQIEQMAHVVNNRIFAEPMNEKELGNIINNTSKYKAQDTGDNPYLIYNSKGVPSSVNYRAINDYFVNAGDVFVIGGECFQYREGVYVESSSHVRNSIKEMISVDTMITQSRIVESYRLILDDTRIQKLPKDLNSDKNLINFKNGVWDIKQKTLLPHGSQYLQTLQIPHNVEAFTPFEDTLLYGFFQECELEEPDINMIMQYMAYCITLGYGLKTFMILSGPSNTGKSVLIRFFETLVGKFNTAALSMHELNMRFYPAQLYDKLLNCCADNSSLPLQSIESLKKITGGDQIMHEKKGNPNIFFFTPFAKLLFSFNQLPLQLEEKSNAFYKRMRILSMTKELKLNDDYVNKLCNKASVESVIPYLLNLMPLKSVIRTPNSDRLVESLRQDSDTIHAFIADSCELNPKAWCYKAALYEQYARYCTDSGREAHKKHTFMRHIRSLGITESRHPTTREAAWRGIKIIKR